MANSDKDILITPNTGGGTAPKIKFVGADDSYGTDRTISINAVSDDSGTLSFLNNGGDQVFSINNNKSDIIFSVNRFDDSSTPLIEVINDQNGHGVIQLARYKGQVVIGGDSGYADSDDYLVVHKNIRLLNAGKITGNGSGLTSLVAGALTGSLPAIDGNSLTNLDAAEVTGTVAAATNSTTLGNLYNYQFLRSDASDNYTSGTLEFQDNTMLAFGAASDTIIEHDTGLNPDGTRFYANSSTGGMLFQDGSTTIFDVAYSNANTVTFKSTGTARVDDNTYFYWGSGSDTYIRHNGSSTEFVANSASGNMVFKDGTAIIFDIGHYEANQATFQGNAKVRDGDYFYFGDGGDTYIRHNTSLNPDRTEFVANTSTGGMAFLDGSTTLIDVAWSSANTTTFYETVEMGAGGIVLGRQTTDNDGNFDLSNGQMFQCTPSGNITLTLSNPSQAQAGVIMLVNSGGHTISAHASLAINADALSALSTAGTYMLSFYCSASSGNDTILIGATGALT
jgi:hypothetical protein